MMQENRRLAQKVERLEKLLNLAAHQKADDMLRMEEVHSLQHQVSVPAVPHRLPTQEPSLCWPHLGCCQVYLGVLVVVLLTPDGPW